MAANKEQRWARQLTALNTIAVAVSQSLKLEYIIKVALAETMRALEIEFGWVYLSNAIKFTSAGGKVMITVRSREGDEGLVEMRVSDTGSGISPREQAHLFERFYRGEATARGIPGTGLGLAIVKEIVGEHGGSVGVESKLGVGSTFTVLLPGRKPGDGLWSCEISRVRNVYVGTLNY